MFHLLLPDADVLGRAQDRHLNQDLWFWDALIVAGCLESRVHILYSTADENGTCH